MTKKNIKIAVASGKGGTGKTTISTNLARAIAKNRRAAQYLDCDVEEPNGHIFLKPEIQKSKAVTIDVPEVDNEKCNGCGRCSDICQYNAIVSLKKVVVTFDQLCHSCGGCKLVCPTSAITDKAKEIGFVDIGVAKEIGFIQGRLNIGDIHTPPLIKEVKKAASSDSVIVIDAPPGTSCPVIEAIKDCDFVVLVTEPTPFGLNDLRLAVGMVRELKLPFAVVINRSDAGDDEVLKYCSKEKIDVALEIRDDIEIAKAYSKGEMIVDVAADYERGFIDLFDYIDKNIQLQEKLI